MDRAVGGDAQALIVRGESGVGKTTLLENLVEANPSFRVERAVGIES